MTDIDMTNDVMIIKQFWHHLSSLNYHQNTDISILNLDQILKQHLGQIVRLWICADHW